MAKPTTVLSVPLLAALLLAGGPLAAQQGDRPVIRVSGSGQVTAPPDVAHVSFAVQTFAETAREAGRLNAEQMSRVVAALRRAGAAEGDIETRGYSVHPVYDHRQPPRPMPGEAVQEDPRIRGYQAANQVTLEIRDLDAIGRFIDVGLEAGANRLAGVRFELRDSEEAHGDALRQAVERARRSAEVIARALGVRLGAPVEVSTQLETPPMWSPRAVAAMEMAADAPTPISPADQTVTANVTIAFAIE